MAKHRLFPDDISWIEMYSRDVYLSVGKWTNMRGNWNVFWFLWANQFDLWGLSQDLIFNPLPYKTHLFDNLQS